MSPETRIVSEIVSDLLMCRDHLRGSTDIRRGHRNSHRRPQYKPLLVCLNRPLEPSWSCQRGPGRFDLPGSAPSSPSLESPLHWEGRQSVGRHDVVNLAVGRSALHHAEENPTRASPSSTTRQRLRSASAKEGGALRSGAAWTRYWPVRGRPRVYAGASDRGRNALNEPATLSSASREHDGRCCREDDPPW